MDRAHTFDAREKGRLSQFQQAQTEHQLKLDRKNQMDANRQQALQNQGGMLSIGSGIQAADKNAALGNQVVNNSNQLFQMQNADSMNRYTAGINAQQLNFQNEMARHNAKGPSFMDSMLGIGGTLGMAALMGPTGANASLATKGLSSLFGSR
jgi:hypothetical protein